MARWGSLALTPSAAMLALLVQLMAVSVMEARTEPEILQPLQQQKYVLPVDDLGSSGAVPGVLAMLGQRSMPQRNSTHGGRSLLETASQQRLPAWRGR